MLRKSFFLLLSSSLLLVACDHSQSEAPEQHSQETDPQIENKNQSQDDQLVNLSPVQQISEIDLDVLLADSQESESNSFTVSDETQNNQSGIDYSQYTSIDEVIQDLIREYEFPSDQLGIMYSNFVTNENFELNPDWTIHAASTNKVGSAAMFIDLIDSGELSWESEIPFSEAYYEEGAGDITNNPFESSYSLEDLIYNSIVFSDNTAWNTLINYYSNNYGSFQHELIEKSGISQVSDEIYNLNYGSPRSLNEILKQVATNPKYEKLVAYMGMAQPNIRFRLHIDEGMATKYGQYGEGYHDTGIYFENGEPVYTLVLMSRGLGMIDSFMGDLNLRVNEWYHYQESKNS